MQNKPAGFWIRSLAYLIDLGLIFLLAAPFNHFLSAFFPVTRNLIIQSELSGHQHPYILYTIYLGSLIFFLTNLAYHGLCYRTLKVSLGKKICGLRLFYENTQTPPSLPHLFVRELIGKSLSFLLLGSGFWLILFRNHKQCLHDMLVGTETVWKSKDVQTSFDP